MSKSDTDQDLALLEAQISALRDDIAHIVTTLGELRQTSAETLRASLSAHLETLRMGNAERVADIGNGAETKFADLADRVRRNPWQALALAGGVGMLVGLLWGRR